MCCTSKCIGLLWMCRPGEKLPPPRTEDASHVPVVQERPRSADISLTPQDNFCKDRSLHWAETFQLCSGLTQQTDLSVRTLVLPSSERRCTRGGRCFGPALCGLGNCFKVTCVSTLVVGTLVLRSSGSGTGSGRGAKICFHQAWSVLAV